MTLLQRLLQSILHVCCALALSATLLHAAEIEGGWTSSDIAFNLIEEDDIFIGDILVRSSVVGSLVGVANGRRLTGIYVRDGRAGSYQGFVSSDGKRISLLAGDINGSAVKVWSAARVRSSAVHLSSFGKVDQLTTPFEGKWRTRFGTVRIHSIRGRYFVGDYSDRGIVFGTATDNRLFGTFTNRSATGILRFRLDTPDKWFGLWRFSSATGMNVDWWGRRLGDSAEVLTMIGNRKSIDTRPARLDPNSDYNAGYRARETAAMRPGLDFCGPQFLTDAASIFPDFLINEPFSEPFEEVCQRHDACFQLKEKTQKFCDDQMIAGMHQACSDIFIVDLIARAKCERKAIFFSIMLRTTYGADAFGGLPHGLISNVRARRIEDTFSDDEVEICIDVHNPSAVLQEYDVELYSGRLTLVDREPDSFEFNVDEGATKRDICVGTNFSATWSIKDLIFPLSVHLRADSPSGYGFIDDMVVVDGILVDRADLR